MKLFQILTILVMTGVNVFGFSQEFSVCDGVKYQVFSEQNRHGPLKYYIARINLNSSHIVVDTQLAHNFVLGKEKVSKIARREGAVIAVNAAFYAENGDPLGMVVMDGRVVSMPMLKRASFGVSKTGKVFFGNPEFSGHIELSNGKKIEINGLNQVRQQNQIILFTPEFGYSTRTNSYGKEIAILNGKVIGINTCNTIIPPDGYVVAFHGDKIDFFNEIDLWDSVHIQFALNPPWDKIRFAVGGGPWLVKNGEKKITAREENFQSDVVQSRSPRTAVGITDSNELLLVVVDGRQADISVGCTLNELAAIIIKNGGKEAINLDGGGSSTFCVNGKIVNNPSDRTEREVSNAILVKTLKGR